MTRRTLIVALSALSMVVSGCSAPSSEGEQIATSTSVAIPYSTPTTTLGVELDGVSATASTINVGILADLTGPYSSGVVDVVDAQLAFWSDLNDNGGIDGRKVEVLIEDTGYDTTRHLRAYHRLVDDVVMFSHSTGTAQTAAISDLLIADHRIAIPLTWYSGWSGPDGRNLVEIGSNYCVEAVNTLAYLHDRSGERLNLAMVTVPGDFGADSARGLLRAAAALDVDIVHDGAGTLDPDADLSAVGRDIATSGADWVWLSADPSQAIQVVAAATQFGYDGGWTGSSPTWNSRLLATQLGPLLGGSVVIPSLVAPLGTEVDGMGAVYDVLAERLPDRYPSEALVVGYLEFEATRRVLEAASAAGDLTPAGVERVAGRIVGTGYEGMSPAATAGDLVTATGVSRFSYETFVNQSGLAGTLASGAVTPITPVAAFGDYAAAASLDYAELCPTPGEGS